MTYKIFIFAASFFCVTNTVISQTLTFSDNYFFYSPDSTKSNGKWIILLPGSSGLTIFDDKTFYNRQAETLKNLGYSVILLDYKAFYKSSQNKTKPNNSTGDKIAWVIKQTILLAKCKKQIELSQNGHLLGWSLAGEGVFTLLKDTAFINKYNIKSVGLYYPSNQSEQSITTTIPLLIQIGEEDNVVNPKKLESQIENSENIKVITYQNSFHGFDIETLTDERIFRFPPLFGKKYIFKYNVDVASKAKNEFMNFLNK